MIDGIAKAVAELSKLILFAMKGKPTRHMKKAINYGEKYIRTNTDSTLSPKNKAKLLDKYEKKFFKYN